MPVQLKLVQPIIDVHAALDLLGKPFWGQYEAGLAEWLKNSKDEYIRRDLPDDESYVILHLDQRGNTPNKWLFECIDFGGTNAKPIEEALMRWCDPSAAVQGKDVDTFGGHGNGGKFHMRDNFRHSYFITYNGGKLTVMGFDHSKNKNYGLDPRYTNRPMKPADAVKFADLEVHLLPEPIRKRWASGKPEDIHFTVVRGIGLVFKQRNWRGGGLSFLKRFVQHPQAKIALARTVTSWAYGGKVVIERLQSPRPEPKDGYEEPREYAVPGIIELDGTNIKLTADGKPIGKLTLFVAKSPFPRRGEEAALNAIDIIGKVGIIANYPVLELKVTNLQGSAFIYGTCHAPLLEQFRENDRKRLMPCDQTDAVLTFIADKVDELAAELAADAEKEEDKRADAVTDYFNKVLNRWKNNFLQQFTVEIKVGAEQGAGIGGKLGGNGSGPGTGTGVITGEGAGSSGGTAAGPAGTDPETAGAGGGAGPDTRRASRFPTVLVSGQHEDPTTDQSLILDPAQPVIYQNAQHARLNIWWINAQRPLAKRLRMEGATNPRWRDYMFQRYIDIITTYTIEQQWRPDTKPEDVQEWIKELVGKLHDSASHDTSMQSLLFSSVPDDVGPPPEVNPSENGGKVKK